MIGHLKIHFLNLGGIWTECRRTLKSPSPCSMTAHVLQGHELRDCLCLRFASQPGGNGPCRALRQHAPDGSLPTTLATRRCCRHFDDAGAAVMCHHKICKNTAITISTTSRALQGCPACIHIHCCTCSPLCARSESAASVQPGLGRKSAMRLNQS